MIKTKVSPIFLDEIGQLELYDQCFHPLFNRILQNKIDCVITVREDLVDKVIAKYNLKLQLIRPTTKNIPYLKMEQFNKVHYAVYLNVFGDVGYVNNEFPDPTNTMVNTLQFSGGIGIDLVTYYDQVFRIDYAINRIGERAFFFHIETPFSRW
jgi:hypothetical protein